MFQGVVNYLLSFSQSVDALLRGRTEAVIEVLLPLLALSFVLLLVSYARERRAKAESAALQGRIIELEQKVATLSNLQSSAAVQVQLIEEPLLEDVAKDRAKEIPPPASPIELIEEESAMSRGLKKSRLGLLSRITGLFAGRPTFDQSALDDLEELLILSDVGARCAADLVSEVKQSALEAKDGLNQEELKQLIKAGIKRRLAQVSDDRQIYHPTRSPLIVLVVGVNGVGKTTTVAKLATKYIQQGKKVLAVAADTFRAAAVEQLAEWSSRVGFTLVRGVENAKPSAVVFDGMVAAKSGEFDVVLIDTAGRLHTKSNLMQELEGVRNSIRKHFPDAPHESVLVLDGVSGQNALSQAREFNQAVALTGIVVTKLDGTPKGGIIVAISQELNLPVFFIGVGERVEDLLAFSPDNFVEALFEEELRTSAKGSGQEGLRVSNQ